MFHFFTTPTQDAEGFDAVTLSFAGFVAVAVIIAALIIAALLLRPKKERSRGITTRQLVFSSAAMALGTVTSMIKFADLPMGGSITLFSMLFLTVRTQNWYHNRGCLRTFAVHPAACILYTATSHHRLSTGFRRSWYFRIFQ